MTNQAKTLTEVENLGLDSLHNMADGHAYHDLTLSQTTIIQSLPDLWRLASTKKQHQAEREFLYQFSALSESPTIQEYPHFRICPTASNSIDVAAAFLKAMNKKVALIEPTFDNLYLILKRRDVSIMSVDESFVHEGNLDDLLKQHLDVLFIVNPNNPSGRLLNETRFKTIVDWCATNNIMLVFDNSFRFFYPQNYDQFQILLESRVSFIAIEDTGKVWSTQDLKASLLFFSANIAELMNIIYEEIYLCVSNFQLIILTHFMHDAEFRGLDVAVWNEVKKRRSAFRRTIAFSPLQIHPKSLDSNISVEWVAINPHLGNDFEMLNFFKKEGLMILPGRLFFWNSSDLSANQYFIRFSLLKPRLQFDSSLMSIKKTLGKLRYLENAV